jgi:hypothetical protein
MKLFEGKSPAERNKIIAVIVLGTLAVISLTYTFGGLLLPGRSGTSAVASADSPTPRPDSADPTQPVPAESVDEARVNRDYAVTPVGYNGGRVDAPISGRNIFAFYEPPEFTPAPTVEVVKVPTFTPTPEAPLLLTFLSPTNAYAGSKDFRIEAVGDKFTTDSRIIFNGNVLPTSFLNSQRLAATVSAALIARSGAGSVFVNTPDGSLYSYPVTFTVIEPPRPDFEFIGLIARQHYNNDTAYFQDKGRRNDDPFTARLNDIVKGRFRVISISAKEVEFEDVRLGFRHKLPLLRPDETSAGTGVISFDNDDSGNDTPVSIPGIPDSIPRAAPRSRPVNPTRRDLNKAIEEMQKQKQQDQDNDVPPDEPEPPVDDDPNPPGE